MKNKVAVYPGTFDPFHNGHLDVIQRCCGIFDEIIVLISKNNEKKSLFSVQDREKMIRSATEHLKNVRVTSHDGLTVDFLKAHNSQVIVRGLRATADFEYEMSMALLNRKLDVKIETLLMFATAENYCISSRSLREIIAHHGDISSLVPSSVETFIKNRRDQ
jgi:pantetheine-phosphate adenylyltransferase